jgi:ring-1,2-phenylacetyl-CoA epoxidase subunit PaaE
MLHLQSKTAGGPGGNGCNWGLEHEEVEQGFILTCQSHPITEKVVVDFDIK